MRVLRPGRPPPGAAPVAHDGELLFLFVLQGEVELRLSGSPDQPTGHGLHEADAVAIPAGLPFKLVGPTGDLELLEVALRAEPVPLRPPVEHH